MRLLIWLLSLVIGGLFVYTMYSISPGQPVAFYSMLTLLAVLLLGALLLRFRKKQKRKRILARPFPSEWRSLLQQKVNYYNRLNAADKQRFEDKIKLFLGTTRITGIQTGLDDEVRLLVAVSAIIPIFAFSDWEYRNLHEVLIYPGSFDQHTFADGDGKERALGMVGSGAMNGKMILSKPALLNGFLRQRDGQNTGIHEFVHLLDGTDGAFDGIPALADKQYVMPWMGMVYREIKRMHRGQSELRSYGASNKVEFFAVASEYFFERPDELHQENPKLYKMLSRFFQQELTSGRLVLRKQK